MLREARIIGGEATVVHGRDLVEQIEKAMTSATAGMISFGLCGALAPGLTPGTMVIGEGVVVDNARHACDRVWSDRLSARLPRSVRADVAGSEAIVATPAAKATLRRHTGAAAADMESQAVAAAARRAGLPFAVLRAVSDGFDRALPEAAQRGLKPDGAVDVGAVVRALIARPGDLPALLRTAREAGAAFRSLGHARDLLGSGLGCPYLGELALDMA